MEFQYLNWIADYLSPQSHTSICESQGSVVVPLLYVTYVNDIIDSLRSTTILFAGDRSIFLLYLLGVCVHGNGF